MLSKMNKQRFKQQGLSLIEMMVALTIGMIVVSGALYLSTSAMAVSRDNIRMSFLNQELRQAMNLMTSDLRRASYWGGAMDATRVSSVSTLTFSTNAAGAATLTLAYDPTDVSNTVVDSLGAQAVGTQLVYLEKDTVDPFPVMSYTATITAYDADTNAFTATLSAAFPATVLATGGGAAKGTWGLVAPVNAVTATLTGDDCAIFSYDVNGNGLIDDGTDTDERFGFRYDATDKAVEIRKGGTVCNGTGWENITDEKSVEITSFTITDQSTSFPAGIFTINIREYTIVMTGRLKSDTSMERTLRETIRVRNDQVT